MKNWNRGGMENYVDRKDTWSSRFLLNSVSDSKTNKTHNTKNTHSRTVPVSQLTTFPDADSQQVQNYNQMSALNTRTKSYVKFI